jgi:protein O-GlcNAc transferase
MPPPRSSAPTISTYLIDLAGHSAGHRLLVLARRPAPIQATWIGYPNTTGLDAIDYRITDHVSDPPGQTEAFHSEKLVRLTGSVFLLPTRSRRPARQRPPRRDLTGTVTFGCFNQFAKITPAAIELWARILAAVPASRLLLKSRGLGDPALAARIRSLFAAVGVAPERLTLNGDELSVHDHLSLYHGVDIALDPFPYNGTTTTCEALWMGVPVVTLAGRTHVARVGASLLTHTGLGDWIAATPDHYAEIAIAAAQDLPRLAELRRTLRERLHASPLCDARHLHARSRGRLGHTRDLRTCLRKSP